MNKITTITLFNLPKVSLNEYYAGKHWTKRKKLKDTYKLIVKNQFKGVFSKENSYKCIYTLFSKNKPFDATNCAVMIKMIEDIIFEDDSFTIIPEITIKSKKGESDLVKIEVEQLNN